jgi:hypothetical protein
VLEVIQSHEPPLHGVEHDAARRPVVCGLGRSIDDGPWRARQAQRTALADPAARSWRTPTTPDCRAASAAAASGSTMA